MSLLRHPARWKRWFSNVGRRIPLRAAKGWSFALTNYNYPFCWKKSWYSFDQVSRQVKWSSSSLPSLFQIWFSTAIIAVRYLTMKTSLSLSAANMENGCRTSYRSIGIAADIATFINASLPNVQRLDKLPPPSVLSKPPSHVLSALKSCRRRSNAILSSIYRCLLSPRLHRRFGNLIFGFRSAIHTPKSHVPQ